MDDTESGYTFGSSNNNKMDFVEDIFFLIIQFFGFIFISINLFLWVVLCIYIFYQAFQIADC